MLDIATTTRLGGLVMTNEEYAMLRSIAAVDGTEGPNFDPALLTELLDAFDALRGLLVTVDGGRGSMPTLDDYDRIEAYRQGKYNNDVIGEFALALKTAVQKERKRCIQVCRGRSTWADAQITTETDKKTDDMWANYGNACDDCAREIAEPSYD